MLPLPLDALHDAVEQGFGPEAAATVSLDRVTATRLPGTGGGSFTSVVERIAETSPLPRWSLVAKRLSAGSEGSAWDREVDALQDRAWLDTHLPPGLIVPRVYGIHRDDRSVTLLLEDLPDGGERTSAFFAESARLLTQFNTRPAERRSWWSSGFLQDEFRRLGDHPDRVDAGRRSPESDHPSHTAEFRSQIRRLLELAPGLCRVLPSLPHGPAHLDAFSRNLIGDDLQRPIGLIDWASAGSAPLGTDPATLFVLSVNYLDVGDPIEELEQSIVDGMLRGLARSSARPGEVLDGFHIVSRLRHLAMMMNALPMVERGDPAVSAVVGQPLDMITERWIELGAHLLRSDLDSILA